MYAVITRRRFLRASAITLVGTSSLTLDRAPAVAQKRELTFLSFNHFVPASDDELKRQAEVFGKQAGVTVRVDTIQAPQLFAKRAAQAASQSGHDLIVTGAADPFLYEQQLIDMGDLVDYLGGRYGGWYPFAKETCQTASGWRAVPWFWVAFPGCYNEVHFKKAGLQPPKTWDDLLKAGKILKKQGNPGGYRHQPLHGCEHQLLVHPLVQRRQGARDRRQDAGDQQRQGGAGRRVVQGALQGRHGA